MPILKCPFSGIEIERPAPVRIDNSNFKKLKTTLSVQLNTTNEHPKIGERALFYTTEGDALLAMAGYDGEYRDQSPPWDDTHFLLIDMLSQKIPKDQQDIGEGIVRILPDIKVTYYRKLLPQLTTYIEKQRELESAEMEL